MSLDHTKDSGLASDRERQIEEVIADYIRACENGRPPNRGDVLARHPEVAAELRQFFAQRDRMQALAGPIRGVGEALRRAVGPGRRIAYVGNYELLEEVARGGMGVVYKARQTTLGRLVAVKMISAGGLATEQDVQRFQREAQAAAALQHANIVSIHEVGQHEDWHYFSMDYVAARDLSALLQKHPLSAKQAATFVRQMAAAIHYAHQRGTLHRDIKPSNVLIDSEGQVHITDFGLATRVEGGSELTQTGQILGTPSYMPPEQALGRRDLIGPGSDVYALGAVLYECLTGRPPFRAESVAETIQQVIHAEPASPRLLNPIVPFDLETICLKCLDKEPHRRYETAQQLAEDLERYLEGHPIVARPVGSLGRAWRWCRRNRAVATLLATVAVCLILGTAVSSYFGIEARQRAAAEAFERRRADNERRDAERARRELQQSYNDLKQEQQRSSQLRQNVADLERRQVELDASLIKGEDKLRQGEAKLFDTYLKLARAAWRIDNIELADYYLNQCPPCLRTPAWHQLKRRCYPIVVTFDGGRCVSFNHNATMLAAAADNGISIWDVETKRLVCSFAGGTNRVQAIDFSPDDKLVAVTDGQQVIVWDLATRTVTRSLTGHAFPVTDVTFNPDGQQLASASFIAHGQGEVILWNLQTGGAVKSVPGARFAVFSHDGRWLATTQFMSKPFERIVVWDMTALDGEAASPSLEISAAAVRCRPAFHPFQNQLAVSKGNENTVEFWDMNSKQVVKRFTGELRVDRLTFSSDGKRLAYSGITSEFAFRPGAFRTVISNLITGEKERTLPWFSSAITETEFSSDGRHLATAEAALVKMWDVTPPPDPTEKILSDIVELKVGERDWPQWGGSRARINTPAGKNIPTTWDVGELRRTRDKKGNWQENWKNSHPPPGSRNIKWATALGSQTYGNPVVANGRIYLGTNNGAGYLKRYPRTVDLGVLLCLEEETGKFLWQHSNEKLPTGRVHDWPLQGVCSTPVIDGNRLWYVSNRGEVVCLDAEGFYDDEDDGPVQNEWVPLFRVDALLHGQLNGFTLPASLKTAFAEAGYRLPPSVSVRRSDDGQMWTIRERRRDPETNRIFLEPLLYRVRLVNDRLSIFRADANVPQDESGELFSVSNHLLPNLGSAEVVFSLREQLDKHGVQLLPETQPISEQAEGVWSFLASMDGEKQLFQVRAEGTGLRICKQLRVSDKDEADVVWKFNMMTELGVSQHNMANCSILTVDGKLFLCTSNGLDESHVNLPAPEAPSFIAMDRETGEVIWTDNSPGTNILHAQWASPSYGVFDGQPQVIFPGGDGWVYSFDPNGDGKGGSKLLWRFDGNPKTSQWRLGGRGTRNNIIAFPAIYDGLVYIVMGQDPEHGEGPGHLWCIDPTKRTDGSDVSAELAVDQQGNVIPHRRLQAVDIAAGERPLPNPNSAVVWHYSHQDQDGDGNIGFAEMFHRSLSIPVIKDDVLYVADFSGLFHCLNAKTGKVYWTYDQLASCWGSALLVDGKVYICDEDGDVTIFRHSADPHVAMKAVTTKTGLTEFVPINARWDGELVSELNMGTSIYMTPVVANNVLYIATRDTLYAIVEDPPNASVEETESSGEQE